MDNIIIKNLNYNYDKKIIFNNLNLEIIPNSFVTIVGKNGSGKTTLANILLKKINNIELIRKNKRKTNKTVLEYLLKKIEIPKEELIKKLKEITKEIGIENILNKNINELNIEQNYLLNLFIAILKKNDIIIIDTNINELNDILKNNIYLYLKEQNITIINMANDLTNILYSDYMHILNNGKIELSGKPLELLKEEKKIKQLGFELPFMIDLSNKLKYYGLVDKTIIDMNEMVDTLWK